MVSTNRAAGPKTNLQKASQAVGAVFLLVGVLGFIPGVTSNYESLAVAGHGSQALLLGVFQVSVLHNIVHLLFGVVGLVLAKTADGARTYFLGGGSVYLLLWVVGLAGAADWIPANTADDWLHFGFGVGMILLGLVAGRATSRVASVA
jgi:Domain of unknown function (DUF4383)